MANAFYFPLPGTPTAPGNQLSFFVAGLDQPLDVWTDPDLAIPWSQPIIFNAAGEPDGPIYVSSTPDMKVVYTDADDVAIPGYPVDFVTPSTIPGVMTTSITVLTNAQIKALPTTPITLVAAPASGLRVRVFSASLRMDCTAGAYTNLNATYVDLHSGNYELYGPVDDSATTPALTLMTTFLTNAAVNLFDAITPNPAAMGPASGGLLSATNLYVQNLNVIPAASVDGHALTIEADNNGSGAFTGGNAANSLTVVVYYTIESLV